jgi:hypothetical protein
MVFERNEQISKLVGRSVEIDDDLNQSTFWKVWEDYPELKPVKTIETENVFWERWFFLLLKCFGVEEDRAGIESVS